MPWIAVDERSWFLHSKGLRVAVEWALFWAFIGGLAWCPYWYGSNEVIAWGVNALIFPSLVIILELFFLFSGNSHPVGIKQIWIPAALFSVTVLWIILQNTTWLPPLLHHPIWEMAGDALGQTLGGSISVNRDLTTLGLIRLITAASVFWIALQLCRDQSRANHFLVSMVIIFTGYSAFGLITFAVRPENLYWVGNTLAGTYVTSTFFNRNHFATYAGMGLVTTCGLIFRLYGRQLAAGGGSIGFKIASIIEVTGRQGAFLIGGAFVIFVAILLTGSRGGLLATSLGVLAFGTLLFKARMNDRREIAIFGVLLIASTFLAFGDTVSSQVADKGIADANRVNVYIAMLRSISYAPFLGYGYGTFIDVFPMFRDKSNSATGLWEFAHNTYLEVFQGLGLVFGACLIVSVVLLFFKCLKGALARQEGATVPRIATSVALLVGIHALIDFSLQIQAVTLTFMAILGAGVAQSVSSRLVIND